MKEEGIIRVLIADDHQIFLEGVRFILAQHAHIRVVAEARSGSEALNQLRFNEADVAVLDISMPGMDGIETTRALAKEFPNVKVLMLTMHNTADFIQKVREAGASGYILKERGRDELISAIEAVAAGDQYYSPEVTRTIMNAIGKKKETPGADLTDREKEVLRLVAQGKTTNEIAGLLFIAPSTVETHRRNLLSKLGMRNSPELVKFAIENGLA